MTAVCCYWGRAEWKQDCCTGCSATQAVSLSCHLFIILQKSHFGVLRYDDPNGRMVQFFHISRQRNVHLVHADAIFPPTLRLLPSFARLIRPRRMSMFLLAHPLVLPPFKVADHAVSCLVPFTAACITAYCAITYATLTGGILWYIVPLHMPGSQAV
jgi:hypothetical protein